MAGTTADKLAKLKATKEDLKAAITEKGGTVGDVFREYPAAVRALPSGPKQHVAGNVLSFGKFPNGEMGFNLNTNIAPNFKSFTAFTVTGYAENEDGSIIAGFIMIYDRLYNDGNVIQFIYYESFDELNRDPEEIFVEGVTEILVRLPAFQNENNYIEVQTISALL